MKNEYQLDVQVKTDGTYGVDFEIVLPYMVITSNFFKDTLQKLCSALESIGASTFESAGIHHNISLQVFNKNLCIEEFSKKSFKKKQNLPLNEFIEKGYTFVLDSDVTPEEILQIEFGLKRIFVENVILRP